MAEIEETKPSMEEKTEVEKEQITPTEQIKEGAVEEVKEAAPEVPEEKTEIAEEVKKEEKKEEEVPKIWPRKRRRRGSRVISGVTREDFVEFAGKFYPNLVEDFEAERISFEELKTRVERDSGLRWVDLKE